MKLPIPKQYITYIVKFIGCFCLLYFTTVAIEGLATPANRYAPFVAHYLDYPALLRYSLLYGSRFLLSLLGYNSIVPDGFHLQLGNSSVQLVYACLGVGVTCFWLAFVFANNGTWKKKAAWMLGGSFIIWCINVVRISLLLKTSSQNQQLPFGMDNHTFFNILAYAAIFILIYFFDRGQRHIPPLRQERGQGLGK